MKKGIIVNLRPKKLLDYVKNNKFFIILCTLFIVGVALGSTVLSNNGWLSQNTELYFNNLIELHTKSVFLNRILSCFARYITVLMLYFISGASILGLVITPFITVWQGIFISSLVSYIYSAYGLSGIAFNAVILILPLSIFVVCCFFAAKYAIDFSLCIAKLILPKSRPISLYVNFKNYSGKYLIIVGISIICSFVEIILNMLFLDFFKF